MQRIPQLRVPLAEAERALNHAFTTGNNFHFSNWSGSQLAITGEQVDRWYRDVSETLRGIFSTPEMAEQFMAVSHDIPRVEEGDRRHLPVRQTFDNRLAWLRRLQENLGIYAPAAPVPAAKSPNIDFDKVSFKWLFEHLPAKIWFTIGAGILVLIGLGISLGQLSVVQEFIGKKPSLEQPAPRLSSEELKVRIDQLLKGHNDRKQKITEEIVGQNHSLRFGDSETAVKLAIEDLRKQMDLEDAGYQNDLKGLQAFERTK